MQAYIDNKKIGDVVSWTWRPYDERIIGSLLIEGYYDPIPGSELVLYNIEEKKKLILKDFKVTNVTDEVVFTSIGFEASESSDWISL